MNRNSLFLLCAVIAVGIAAFYASNSAGVKQDIDASASPQGAAIVVVNVPDVLSATAKMGKQAYDAKCASCHGNNAEGQDGIAPPLIHKIYEPSHHGDEAFQRAAKLGVRSHHWPFGDMPPVEGLTRADVGAVVAYIREVQRENGIN
ncbi:MAG: cytochrome c [Amylibacter sp.]|jgi:mono/diheme cytochrome c family protein|nr:cytochrome c [Amylibacter sp.]